MATPHVAGAWALLKSAKPNATVDEVLAALQTNSVPIVDSRNGLSKPLIQIGNTSGLTSPTNNGFVTAPASVTVTALAGDTDGVVTKIEFYRDGALIATLTSPSSGMPGAGTWSYTDTNLSAGTYSYTAKAYDNGAPSAATTSAAALVSVTATTAGSVNVAARTNGATASASSTWDDTHSASAAIDGDRKGLTWWNDITGNSFPDWLQVNFNGTYSIGEIDVFSIQDAYDAPVDPTAFMVRQS
jgi:hypothetical protein